jgi:hypothetical protein
MQRFDPVAKYKRLLLVKGPENNYARGPVFFFKNCSSSTNHVCSTSATFRADEDDHTGRFARALFSLLARRETGRFLCSNAK